MQAEQSAGRRHRITHARWVRDALRFELSAAGGSMRQLPSETELVERYACSRNALREALNLLRDEHLIERRQGAGTLVVGGSPHLQEQPAGLVRSLADGRARVSYRALPLEEVGSSDAICSLLGLAPGTPLSVLPRVTVADGTPTCLWDLFVPHELGRRLAATPTDGDTNELFARAVGMTIPDSPMRVEAVLADTCVADLLEVEVGAPLLRFERVITDAANTIVALSFGRARADRLALLWSPNTADKESP